VFKDFFLKFFFYSSQFHRVLDCIKVARELNMINLVWLITIFSNFFVLKWILREFELLFFYLEP